VLWVKMSSIACVHCVSMYAVLLAVYNLASVIDVDQVSLIVLSVAC